MKTIVNLFILITSLTSSLLVTAHEYTVGSLAIEHPVARETPPGATVGAGYLTITNNSNEDDKLLSATGNIAPIIQVHNMSVENNIMKMQELKEGLVIPAGESVAFQSGGLHIMFMNLPQQLLEGQTYLVNLVFEKSGTIEVKFNVEKFESHNHSDHSEHQDINENKQKHHH